MTAAILAALAAWCRARGYALARDDAPPDLRAVYRYPAGYVRPDGSPCPGGVVVLGRGPRSVVDVLVHPGPPGSDPRLVARAPPYALSAALPP